MTAKGTQPIRVYEDLAEKLRDIRDVTGEQIVDLVDPLIREHIEETHKRLLPSIKQIKAARAKHAKKVTVPDFEVGGEG